MGFLSNLFGLPSFSGATNALLVELVLPKLSPAQRAELKAQYFEIERRGGFPNATDEAILGSLNRSTRVAQLNCLALAMNELGYDTPLKHEFWHNVTNPFDSIHTDKVTLMAVAKRLKSNYGVEVTISSKPLNFDSW